MASRMTTYNTGAPVPSVDVRDLYDNAENLDNFSNGAALAYTDRKGVSRQSLAGIRAASSYQHLGAYGAGLVFTSYNQTFSYLGEFYAPSAGITLPYTTTGAGAGEIANFRSVGDAVLRQDLLASDGAGRVGFGGATVAAELDGLVGAGRFIRPEDFGYIDAGTLSERTAAVQAAFNAANTQKRTFLFSGVYRVDTIQLFGHTEYSITGTGALIGEAIVSRSAVLEMKNCTAITSSGRVTISGNNNVNYAAATKIWADVPGGSSLLTLEFSQLSAAIGWLFGDFAQPDRLLSEIVIRGGFTYSVPQPLVCIGTQTVIEASGYQLIAFSSGPFAANKPVIATAIGAVIHITGGEAVQPSDPLGWAFVSQPIDSPAFDNGYGRITAVNTQIESAGLIFYAYNPASAPSVAANTGGIRLSGCSGYHSFAGESFQGAADFSGSVVVDDTCDFYAPVLRTASTANMSGPASVSISPLALFNFKQGLGAITGGIARFEAQDIFTASNLNGAACPVAGATVLKFVDIPATGNNLRFSTSYNPATGIFTVPPGGLKNVKVFTQFSCIAARPTSEITVLEGGALPLGVFGVPHKYVSETTFIGDLAAGAQITLRIQNNDAAFNFGAVPYDRIAINASC